MLALNIIWASLPDGAKLERKDFFKASSKAKYSKIYAAKRKYYELDLFIQSGSIWLLCNVLFPLPSSHYGAQYCGVFVCVSLCVYVWEKVREREIECVCVHRPWEKLHRFGQD